MPPSTPPVGTFRLRNCLMALALSSALAAAGCTATASNSAVQIYTHPLAPKVLNDDGDVIDLANLRRGLGRRLSTARAGETLLADNGLGSERVGEAGAAPVIDYVEPAPSAPAALKVQANLTGSLLMAAYGQAGRPYKNGGQNPSAGFDAAGFTRWVYGQKGISIPKDLKRQAAGGRQVAREDLRPGDLLVYRDPSGRGYHVGIYTGQGNFLHAAAKAGVVTETAAFGPQYSPYFVGGRRYYDDPKAAPLSDGQKMAAASSAVKTALLEFGPDDQPQRQTYAKPKKSKGKAKGRAARKSGRRK